MDESERKAFISTRKYFFQSMLLEWAGHRRPPMRIIRIYWNLASKQARTWMDTNDWRDRSIPI